MKKLIFITIIFSCFVAMGFSQEADESEILGLDDTTEISENAKEKTLDDFKKNEIYATVGIPSVVNIFGNIIGLWFIGVPEVMIENLKGNKNAQVSRGIADYACLPITVGYNHFFLNNHLGLGAYGSYECMGYMNFFTTQLKLTGQYGWRNFKFYHSLSAGVIVFPTLQGGVAPIFDITYLGLKLDFKYMNIFLEASVPTTALLKIGASVKF